MSVNPESDLAYLPVPQSSIVSQKLLKTPSVSLTTALGDSFTKKVTELMAGYITYLGHDSPIHHDDS